MSTPRPPRGRKPHLLTRLAALAAKVRTLGHAADATARKARRLADLLGSAAHALDSARNPHSPRTKAERVRKAARTG
jgi:hypothetical protein